MQPRCRQPVGVTVGQHDEPERPGAAGDAALLPDGAGHRHLGLGKVQADAKQNPGGPDGGDAAGEQGHQPGGGSLHHDR